jgi:hypothetical protein
MLAGLSILGISLVGAGAAAAGLNDRAGDPVVFTGKDVPRLVGTAPGKVVAFAWRGGWKQIPVQVDERKTVSVRDLYPTPAPRYVLPETSFDLAVYADPDTRTGADPKAWLDADDEIALMAQDAGSPVKPGKVRAPAGTAGAKGTVLTIADPLDGGKGYVYLFAARGSVDQSAGRSYVDYDFKPLYLSPGQSLADGYRYANSANPEDSTVTTDYYSTHSTDRWMDDEIRIKAGDASGVDILDREVAQATRTSCGRSELTFSGNWTEEDRGSDTDEGTFVAVKSGPIRAIRDYMGANSGPYTQRQHIYYQRREDSTTFLRVHPMLDLYTWTDYAAAATGMTYRDQANPDGVSVDGAPDTLDQPDSADFTDGKVFWQQLSGPQGSVSTIASAETDIPNANFGNYYLDNSSAPLTGNNRQCAGDGVSYGSSGFGILGPVTPNTDPRLPVHNDLTVNRVRYFGPPQDGGVATAAALADRVRLPLEVSSSAFRPKTQARLTIRPGTFSVRVGRATTVSLPLVVRNVGNATARGLRVCIRTRKGIRGSCRSGGSLKAGRKVRLRLPVGTRYKGSPVRALLIRLEARAKGAIPGLDRTVISLRRR